MIRLLSVAVFGVGLASAAAPDDQKTQDYQVDPRHAGMFTPSQSAAATYPGVLPKLQKARKLYKEYDAAADNMLARNRWTSDEAWADRGPSKHELDVGDLVTIRYHNSQEEKQKTWYKQKYQPFDVYGKQATVVRKCFSPRGFGLPDTYVVRVNSGYVWDKETGDYTEDPNGKCPLWNFNCVREDDDNRDRYGYLIRGFLQYMGQKSETFGIVPAQIPKFKVGDFVHSTYKFAIGWDTSGLIGQVIRKENPVVGQVMELKSIYPTTYYVRFWQEGAPKLKYAEFDEEELKRMPN